MAEHKSLDRRTVDRYIDKGVIKESEFQSYMKHLPDDENNAQWVRMDLEDAEIGGGAGTKDPSEDT